MDVKLKRIIIVCSFSALQYTFSLTCVSRETHNLQCVFHRILYTNGGGLCQALLAETVETGTI